MPGSPANSSRGLMYSAPGRRRSADAELWRPCEPDVVRGSGTKSGSCVYFGHGFRRHRKAVGRIRPAKRRERDK